jgi:hypothetical protein
MNTVILPNSDLASRRLAATERSKVLGMISDDERLVIDLVNVRSISESYADELFGVLVATFGLPAFLDRVKINNASDNVLRTIAVAINRRKTEETLAA